MKSDSLGTIEDPPIKLHNLDDKYTNIQNLIKIPDVNRSYYTYIYIYIYIYI